MSFGIKTEKEISNIKKSCNISDAIMKNCIKNFNNFKKEKDVYNFIIKEIKKRKLKIAFKPIIGSGKNGAKPHHKAKNNYLKKGFCVIDLGVRYKGYCSDITRTIYLGKIKKKEKKKYTLLLKVQENCIKKSKVGMKSKELFNVAAKGLGNYKKYFIHRLGHGIGKRIHEGISLSKKSNKVLKENMVFTIEPGIYFKNKFGIRIEDVVLLKKNRIEILTRYPKKLIVLDKL